MGLVVYPTYVEHQPRRRRLALAAAASGLGDMPGLTLVPVGDYPAPRQAVEQVLAGLYAVEKRAELSS